MRFIAIVSLAFLVCLPASAQGPRARSLGDYYRSLKYAEQLPGSQTLEDLMRIIGENSLLGLPEQGNVNECIYQEVRAMLAANSSTSILAGLQPGPDFLLQVVSMSEGKIPTGLVWAAACHGFLRSTGDVDALFYPPEEFASWTVCPPGYDGPPHRPEYRARNSQRL